MSHHPPPGLFPGAVLGQAGRGSLASCHRTLSWDKLGDDVVDLESAVVRRGAAVNDLNDEDAGVVADVRVVRAAHDGEAEARAAPLQSSHNPTEIISSTFKGKEKKANFV